MRPESLIKIPTQDDEQPQPFQMGFISKIIFFYFKTEIEKILARNIINFTKQSKLQKETQTTLLQLQSNLIILLVVVVLHVFCTDEDNAKT